jgi:hypothetical protein
VSEASGGAQVEVRRAWNYDGEDEGTLHIELAAGGESLNVNLKAARNPRMFEFIMKHATVTTEPRPTREPKSPE